MTQTPLTQTQTTSINNSEYKPNRLDFNERHNEFKQKLNSFIDELKGIKITSYGSVDNSCSKSLQRWKLPDDGSVPPINNNSNKYFDSNTKCCTISKSECIDKYKKNIKLYNEYRISLTNNNINQKLELNKIEDDTYIVNLKGNILNYADDMTSEIKYSSKADPKTHFKIIKIQDLIHLNVFILKETDKIDENTELLEYPLYLIIPKEKKFYSVTIHNENGSNKLSIEPLSKNSITKQIFYK